MEDAAQAFGAAGGVAQVGDVATFSFFPTKNLSTFGDGGLITTPRDDVADTCRTLRFHGSKDKQTFTQIGYNSRLDELHAAVLRVFLEGVDGWNAARQAAAARYRELGLDEHATLPPDGGVYHLYMARVAERERVVEACKAAGIGCGVYYAAAAAPAAGVRRPAAARPAGDRDLRARGARAADVPDAHRGPAAGGRGRRRVSPRDRVKVWVDLTNAPHAVVLAPLVRALEARGDTVEVTARDYGQTVDIARLNGLDPLITGHHGGGGRAGKARAAAGRVAALYRWARGRGFDAALAHGSTDQPMVARALRHPGDDDVRLRVRRPAALAQLPAGPAHAGARGDPARAPGALRRAGTAARPVPGAEGGVRAGRLRARSGGRRPGSRPPASCSRCCARRRSWRSTTGSRTTCSRACWQRLAATDGVVTVVLPRTAAQGDDIRARGAARAWSCPIGRWTGRASWPAPTWSSRPAAP